MDRETTRYINSYENYHCTVLSKVQWENQYEWTTIEASHQGVHVTVVSLLRTVVSLLGHASREYMSPSCHYWGMPAGSTCHRRATIEDRRVTIEAYQQGVHVTVVPLLRHATREYMSPSCHYWGMPPGSACHRRVTIDSCHQGVHVTVVPLLRHATREYILPSCHYWGMPPGSRRVVFKWKRV